MTQTRVVDYGDPVTSPQDNWPRQYMLTPGVYSGFTLTPDLAFNLVIGTGVGLQPDGVLWQEDTTTTLAFSIPGVATDYTVVATHDDREITGGTPVEYEYQIGLVSTVTDGVVLGWIYYPGGGVSLDATMLVTAPAARPDIRAQALVNTASVRLYAPLARTYSDVATMGANTTFVGQTAASVLRDATFFVNHQRVAKVAGPAGPETLVQYIQFTVGDWRPVGFDFYCNIVGVAELQLELRDTDLNIVTITGSPIVGSTADWEWRSIVVDRNSGVFTSGKPYELRVTHQVDLALQVDLATVVARFWPYPA